MDKLFIVIPAYNEQENIEEVLKEWYSVIEKCNESGESRLVVIDDGSKDSTFEIMKEYQEGHPLFTPLTKQNSGHGATLLYGYNYAIEQGADYIFQTDSDGQTIPEEFYDFWNMRNQHDMIIGYRNKRQDGLSRVFVTKTLKAVIFFCFKVKVTDANTPFRLMKTDKLKENITLIPKDFNLANVLISVIYAKKAYDVCYIPITFRPRQGGVNSINLKKIFKIGKQAIRDFKKINEVIA